MNLNLSVLSVGQGQIAEGGFARRRMNDNGAGYFGVKVMQAHKATATTFAKNQMSSK